jgi:hypothetical protein
MRITASALAVSVDGVGAGGPGRVPGAQLVIRRGVQNATRSRRTMGMLRILAEGGLPGRRFDWHAGRTMNHPVVLAFSLGVALVVVAP